MSLLCYIANHLMSSSSGKQLILFPWNVNVSRYELRFSGYEIIWFPRDQSLNKTFRYEGKAPPYFNTFMDVKCKFRHSSVVQMDPWLLTVTWCKIHLVEEQVVHWDMRNKATSFSPVMLEFSLFRMSQCVRTLLQMAVRCKGSLLKKSASKIHIAIARSDISFSSMLGMTRPILFIYSNRFRGYLYQF